MIERQSEDGFRVYKGVQKPLVFRNFHGRYIYFGLGSVFSGLITSMILISAFNVIVGLIGLVFIGGGGFLFTLQLQKKGLYSKGKQQAILIIKPKFK